MQQQLFSLLRQRLFVFGMQIKRFFRGANQLFQRLESGRSFTDFDIRIINSPTAEANADRLAEFQEKYASEYIEEVGYIKSTWLIPFKGKACAGLGRSIASFWEYGNLPC